MKLKELMQKLLMLSAAVGLSAFISPVFAVPVKAQHHHDARTLVADKLKQDGHHELDHKGKVATSIEVKNGKIAAFHAKHSEKGDLAVKKYKTHKKVVQTSSAPHLVYAAYHLAQLQDMGTEYIGYAYVDDDGNEEIYWVPVEEVYDADSGAVEYVPLSS
jgi:hypothetical protein